MCRDCSLSFPNEGKFSYRAEPRSLYLPWMGKEGSYWRYMASRCSIRDVSRVSSVSIPLFWKHLGRTFYLLFGSQCSETIVLLDISLHILWEDWLAKPFLGEWLSFKKQNKTKANLPHWMPFLVFLCCLCFSHQLTLAPILIWSIVSVNLEMQGRWVLSVRTLKCLWMSSTLHPSASYAMGPCFRLKASCGRQDILQTPVCGKQKTLDPWSSVCEPMFRSYSVGSGTEIPPKHISNLSLSEVAW